MTSQITQEIRSILQLKSARSKRSKFGYDFVVGLADLLPREAEQAIYGISWAMQTCRLPGQAQIAIQKMTAWQYTDLVGQVVEAGLVQNDVPRFLIQKFS